MKLATRIGITLPALILALAILAYVSGYLLSAATHVERATYIDAAPEVVYGLINDLCQFKQWTPWHDQAPDTRYRIRMFLLVINSFGDNHE